MKKLIPVGVFVVIILGASFLFIYNSSSPLTPGSKQTNESSINTSFSNPKKSAHYESNTPEHGSTLAGVPINVVINFNFDLAVPSDIKIENDGKDYGIGETEIDENKLSMRKNMDPNSPNGIYTVNYKACWPDGSCHDGGFQFAIDRTQDSSYDDMIGQNEITIRMSEIQFMPKNLKIGKGTKVTWVNNDEVEHFVNTDSHPAHTYFPNQNSKALKTGDTYSVTFSDTGIYLYHCSAHADSMIGSILVE